MFIWDFVADKVLGQIVDWFYGQVVGFLGNFFAEMGNMGVELFEIPYTFQPASPQCFFADCFRIAQRNPAARTMASTGSTDLLPQVILASAHPAASNISRALLLSSIW